VTLSLGLTLALAIKQKLWTWPWSYHRATLNLSLADRGLGPITHSVLLTSLVNTEQTSRLLVEEEENVRIDRGSLRVFEICS